MVTLAFDSVAKVASVAVETVAVTGVRDRTDPTEHPELKQRRRPKLPHPR